MEALRGTPVYEEAISVIFHDDFDVEAARNVLARTRNGDVQVLVIEPESISPLARIGVEEVSKRGEIVSPERLRAIIRQSTEARVTDSFLVACCTACWDYIELKRVGSIQPGNCPRCGKDAVGYSTESYETIFGLALKARSRSQLQAKNMKLIDTLRRSSQLVKDYGTDALFLMAGRGIRLGEVGNLLAKKAKEGGDIVDLVIEGEREALKRRYFAQ
jgi:ATP-dependent helicase Lhr and Lhr-like helicase